MCAISVLIKVPKIKVRHQGVRGYTLGDVKDLVTALGLTRYSNHESMPEFLCRRFPFLWWWALMLQLCSFHSPLKPGCGQSLVKAKDLGGNHISRIGQGILLWHLMWRTCVILIVNSGKFYLNKGSNCHGVGDVWGASVSFKKYKLH